MFYYLESPLKDLQGLWVGHLPSDENLSFVMLSSAQSGQPVGNPCHLQ